MCASSSGSGARSFRVVDKQVVCPESVNILFHDDELVVEDQA
jgi:hypothetical protein